MNKISFTLVVALTGLVASAGAVEKTVSPEAAFKKMFFKMSAEMLESSNCRKLDKLNQKEKQRQRSSEDGRITDIDFKGRIYHLDLRNNSDIPLNSVKIECRFFYTEELKWRTKKRREEKTQKYFSDRLKTSLAPRAKTELETDPFITRSWKIPDGYYYKDGSAESCERKANGCWVKVTYKTPGGETLVRDFCEPKSLLSRAEWVEEPPAAKGGKKKNGKKNKKRNKKKNR